MVFALGCLKTSERRGATGRESGLDFLDLRAWLRCSMSSRIKWDLPRNPQERAAGVARTG
jgi:hypothetical protein